jgi:hypothetical protein
MSSINRDSAVRVRDISKTCVGSLLQDKCNKCKQIISVGSHRSFSLDSWLFGLANIVLVDDVFSSIEEKAGRETAAYEGGINIHR